MNTMRIEVPLELPPPHFDDETTIATARKVVPIQGARAIERRRKLLTTLPILLAATLCGALGALAVNYFERPQNAPTTQQSGQVTAATQTKSEPSPAAIAPSSELASKDSESEAASGPSPDNSTATSGEVPAKTDATNADRTADDAATKRGPMPTKPNGQSDPAKLVRKRRVQPENAEVPAKKNGAARIEDIFGGPNP